MNGKLALVTIRHYNAEPRTFNAKARKICSKIVKEQICQIYAFDSPRPSVVHQVH